MNLVDIPGALYDASARIGATRAVARCIVDSLPCGDRDAPTMEVINHLGRLADAVYDLLGLLENDIEKIEIQLKRGNA